MPSEPITCATCPRWVAPCDEKSGCGIMALGQPDKFGCTRHPAFLDLRAERDRLLLHLNYLKGRLGIQPMPSDDEYLTYEANRRGVEIAIVCAEELAAEKRARAKLPSREELKILVQNSNPDPRYLCADDDPF